MAFPRAIAKANAWQTLWNTCRGSIDHHIEDLDHEDLRKQRNDQVDHVADLITKLEDTSITAEQIRLVAEIVGYSSVIRIA